MKKNDLINKTMEPSDLDTPEAEPIIRELNELILQLRGKGLKISSWYGCFELSGKKNSDEVINRGYNYSPLASAVDDVNFPWFLYWEIVWVVLHAGFMPGQKVIDLGGSSSLFSFYLASKGLDVTTVDLQEELVQNADHVADAMGWNLKNYVMDMRYLSFDTHFDHITSICVYEHIPMYDRVEINRNIKKLLVPGGRFSITFDYRNPSKAARINTPSDVYDQFVKPSGLKLRGNEIFVDTGTSYLLHPFYHTAASWKEKVKMVRRGEFKAWEFFKAKSSNDYTFGALFLEKDK